MGKRKGVEEEAKSASRITRRGLLVGGLLTIGGASNLVDSGSTAAFTDQQSAAGTTRIDGDPTLNYQITDESQNSNAEYRISYQVEWASDFAEIEIQVENLATGTGDTFTRSTYEGAIDYPRGGGSDGGAGGDTYRFTFRVKDGSGSVIIPEKITEDVADSDDSGEGDMGNVDSPKLDWVLIKDNSDGGQGGEWRYTVYYEVSKLDEFRQVNTRFKNTNENTFTKTDTSQDSPVGSLSYSQGKGGISYPDFEIRTEVKNQNEVIVDSHTVVDIPEGTDPDGYGDPARTDSPQLTSFTVTCERERGRASFSVSYTPTNTNRLAGAEVTFKNAESSNATSSETIGLNETAEYSQGGTVNDDYEIVMELLETRDGATFPVDYGTLNAAGNWSGTKIWPEDAS